MIDLERAATIDLVVAKIDTFHRDDFNLRVYERPS